MEREFIYVIMRASAQTRHLRRFIRVFLEGSIEIRDGAIYVENILNKSRSGLKVSCLIVQFNFTVYEKIYKQLNHLDNMDIKIILEEQDEGGYTVYVPSLSGCVSQGETVEEALKNIKEAIEIYLESDDSNELGDRRRVMNIKI